MLTRQVLSCIEQTLFWVQPIRSLRNPMSETMKVCAGCLQTKQKRRVNDSNSHNKRKRQELGRTYLHYHLIDTGNSCPVAQRFYRTSPKLRQEIENQIKELVNNGLIEPSTWEWRSPVVMLKRPGNTGYRFANDYRKVNAVSENTSSPLPRLDDVWRGQRILFYGARFSGRVLADPAPCWNKDKSSFIT